MMFEFLLISKKKKKFLFLFFFYFDCIIKAQIAANF